MNQFNEPWIACRSHEDQNGPMFDIDDTEEDKAYYNARPFVKILDAKGNTVVTAHDCFEFDPKHAERILACVNAMAGIDDPAAFVAKHKGNP